MIKKHIFKIDLILIVASVFALIFLARYAMPLVISPIDNLETANSSVLFSFEKADVIYIDDNLDFTSPEKIHVKDDLIINLKPGIYYWKVQGVVESKIRTLTINSEVDLKLKQLDNERFEVVNSGNTRLMVDVYNDTELSESFILSVDEEKESSGNKIIGEQNE